MQQVAMRRMELNCVEPEPGGSPRRIYESVTHGGKAVPIESDRRILAVCERNG
jgi:hypothetical protein